MNAAHRHILDTYAQLAEEARRDRPVAHFKSVAHDDGSFSDWAAPCIAVDRAVSHLGESLPNGQLARTRAAYFLLRAGVDALGVYLREQGIDV